MTVKKLIQLLKKEDKNVPLRRDSVMKTPKTGKDNGAM